MQSFVEDRTVITLEVSQKELLDMLSGGVAVSLIHNVNIGKTVQIRLYCTDIVSEEEHIDPICY